MQLAPHGICWYFIWLPLQLKPFAFPLSSARNTLSQWPHCPQFNQVSAQRPLGGLCSWPIANMSVSPYHYLLFSFPTIFLSLFCIFKKICFVYFAPPMRKNIAWPFLSCHSKYQKSLKLKGIFQKFETSHLETEPTLRLFRVCIYVTVPLYMYHCRNVPVFDYGIPPQTHLWVIIYYKANVP